MTPFAGRVLVVLLACSCLSASSGIKIQQLQQLQTSQQSHRNILASNETPAVKPDYTLYLHKDDLLQKIKDTVSQSPIMTIETISETDGNYTANLLVVTVDAGGVEHKSDPKAKLLLDFGEHGREFISSEVALRFLQALNSDTMLSQLVGDDMAKKVRKFLNHSIIKVIPMENENGRDIVEKGDFCYRKNGRGVDPNRNWDIDWGKKEKDYLAYEEYPGTKPFSEPEVRILLNLTKEFKPHVWLNVHSGMEALFTPYDHKASIPEGDAAKRSIDMLNSINEALFGKRCVVGSGGKSVGYLAHGTATDYMYVGLNVPISMTWEIYGDTKAQFHDCFKMFNPITKESMEGTLTSWVKAILKLMELLPTHPSTEFLAPLLKDGSGTQIEGSATPVATDPQPQSGLATAQDAITQPTATSLSTQQSENTSQQSTTGVNTDAQASSVTPVGQAAVGQAAVLPAAFGQAAAGQAAVGQAAVGIPTGQAAGNTGGRKEGPGDASLTVMGSSAAQSRLMQGAKSAGVWTLTIALVGLVALLATAATYGRQAKRRNIVTLYRPMAP